MKHGVMKCGAHEGKPVRYATQEEVDAFCEGYGFEEGDPDVFFPGEILAMVEGRVRVVSEEDIEWPEGDEA